MVRCSKETLSAILYGCHEQSRENDSACAGNIQAISSEHESQLIRIFFLWNIYFCISSFSCRAVLLLRLLDFLFAGLVILTLVLASYDDAY